GEYVEEEDPATGRTRKVFVPAPFTLSPGSVAHVQGEEIFDGEGRTDVEGNPVVTGTKQASATTLPAGDPSGYVTEMEARRVAMLRRCRQLYALMTGDAAASGESRVQALYELHNDASGLKSVIDRAGKLALSAAWNLACH